MRVQGEQEDAAQVRERPQEREREQHGEPEPEPEPEPEQALVQGPKHHHNLWLRWRGSKRSFSNIRQRSFSKLRQPHCASCEFLEHQPLMQKLQQPGMRRFCLV